MKKSKLILFFNKYKIDFESFMDYMRKEGNTFSVDDNKEFIFYTEDILNFLGDLISKNILKVKALEASFKAINGAININNCLKDL